VFAGGFAANIHPKNLYILCAGQEHVRIFTKYENPVIGYSGDQDFVV
jgi:hypothetical protein